MSTDANSASSNASVAKPENFWCGRSWKQLWEICNVSMQTDSSIITKYREGTKVSSQSKVVPATVATRRLDTRESDEESICDVVSTKRNWGLFNLTRWLLKQRSGPSLVADWNLYSELWHWWQIDAFVQTLLGGFVKHLCFAILEHALFQQRSSNTNEDQLKYSTSMMKEAKSPPILFLL